MAFLITFLITFLKIQNKNAKEQALFL